MIPSPDLNQENNYLWSVAGASASDAWAVGFYDTGTQLKSMTQHWDGAAWTIVPSPNGSTYIDELTDVAMVSPTEVWAVGQSAGFFTFQTLAMRFNAACGSATMHVSNIAPSIVRSSVRASVTIADANAVRVAGATVTVVITTPTGSQLTSSRSTNSRGVAAFSAPASPSGTYTFTVTNVVKSGLTYDASANVETTDSIIVP